MAINTTPTKVNLLKNKSRLEFSNKGYNLLDQKRTVLIQEIVKLVEDAQKIEEQIKDTYKEAYQALQNCAIEIGMNELEDYSLSVKQEKDYNLRSRSIMGVDIPELVVDKEESSGMPLSFMSNSPSLDIALEKFNEVKYLSYELAEIENKAFKLSQEIKKASKSANALSKIQIPQLKEAIHSIEEAIEEKEREEHFRIKKLKSKKSGQ